MYLIHEGVPGSGKSYDAVKRMLDVLKSGRVVYTNIDGVFNQRSLEAICSYTGLDYCTIRNNLRPLDNQTQVKRFWEVTEPGSYVIIDEAQLYWNSRDYQQQDNKDHAAFASTHRHLGYDVLLITQRSERIDTALRALTEWRYRYRKLNFFGSMVKKQYLVYSFNGDDPKCLSTRKGTYDSKVFLCYASYVGDVTEKQVRKPPNILNHPAFWALGIVLVVLVVLFSKSGISKGDVFGAKSVQASMLSEQNSAADQAGPTTQPKAKEAGQIAGAVSAPAATPPADSKPVLEIIGYINGRPVYRHASGRVILDGQIPRGVF